MASSCAGEDLDWILGKLLSLKGWSKIETDCPGHGEIMITGSDV